MAGANPTVFQIVQAWLNENGYTGLFQDECGCTLEDFAPCGEISQECEAGYKKLCKPEDCRREEVDGCQLDCDGFHEGMWVTCRTKEGR